MIQLSKFNPLAKPGRGTALLICSLSLALTAYGQSATDHSGHDHAEEAVHGESHEAHGAHDDHSTDGGHDHAEEAAKGETREAHGEHDEHSDEDSRNHAEEAKHGETHEANGEHDDHGTEGGHDDHGGHGHGAEEDGDEHEGEDFVKLSPEVRREFGIELSRAAPGTLHEEVSLPGEVRFNRAALAYATPRYAGTVQDIRVKLAEQVKKGQVLATLESVDTLRPFEVKAPLDGTIVSYDITPGQTVAAGTSIFTVADLSTVWGDLQIYQANFAQIREGQSVLISGGHNLPTYRGTIDYVAPTVDEQTRTGLARIVMKNAERVWKPGMFIQGAVSVEEHPVDLLVPRSAILTMEDSSVVFVQDADGFEPRPIQLGHSDSKYFEVKGGLKLGETYVSKNPISIKAEMGKGSFGGHNH